MRVSASGSISCGEDAEKMTQLSLTRTFGLLVNLGPPLAGLADHWGIDQGGHFLQELGLIFVSPRLPGQSHVSVLNVP